MWKVHCTVWALLQKPILIELTVPILCFSLYKAKLYWGIFNLSRIDLCKNSIFKNYFWKWHLQFYVSKATAFLHWITYQDKWFNPNSIHFIEAYVKTLHVKKCSLWVLVRTVRIISYSSRRDLWKVFIFFRSYLHIFFFLLIHTIFRGGSYLIVYFLQALLYSDVTMM